MEKIGMIKLSSLYNSKKKNYQDLDKQKSMEEEDFVDNSDVWKGESEKAVVSTQTDKQMCRVNTHARTHARTGRYYFSVFPLSTLVIQPTMLH